MLAYRTRWRIKKGRLEEAVALLQQALEIFTSRGLVARGYIDPKADPRHVVVWEEEWEDAAAFAAFWAEDGAVSSSDEAQVFWAKWNDLVDGKAKHRVWRVLR